MKNKSIKFLAGGFFIFLLLFVTTSPLMMLGTTTAGIITAILYQFTSVLLLKKWQNKCKPWQLLFAMFLGSSCIEIPIRIYAFKETLVSLPVYIGMIGAILMGYLCWRITEPSITD